jgi:hypothetical protein
MAPLLVLSLLAAFLSLAAPLRMESGGVLLGCFLFSVWLALVVFAIRKFRKKGLWLLIGSPIAFLFPALWILVHLFPRR